MIASSLGAEQEKTPAPGRIAGDSEGQRSDELLTSLNLIAREAGRQAFCRLPRLDHMLWTLSSRVVSMDKWA